MSQVLVGLSSWADPGLVRSGFYPPHARTPADRLRYYASRFPLVELDSTYYALPTKRNLDSWLVNTPPGFIFNIKAFSLLTGHPTRPTALPRAVREQAVPLAGKGGNLYLGRLDRELADRMWTAFAMAVRPLSLAGKLGAVLFQFPPWFHFRAENLEHLALCRGKLPRYRLAVEFRSASWYHPRNLGQTLSLLRRHGLAIVCVDGPRGLTSSVPPLAEVTDPGLAMVRFQGRRAEISNGVARTDYLYTEAELREWVPRVRQMAERAERVHLVFKNKHADYPAQNALQMMELLQATPY